MDGGTDTLRIDARFCGPPRSGNGGYVCGRLAALLPAPTSAALLPAPTSAALLPAPAGAAVVRLLAPPPLDVPLAVERGDGLVRLLHAERPVAEARAAALDIDVPAAPSFEAAERAAQRYPGRLRHPFPRCFVCGPARAPDDGLCLFTGRVDAQPLVAAPWRPHASLAGAPGRVDRAFVWAALDCPGAFGVMLDDPDLPMVLGELCAQVDDSPAVDEPCVVIGWRIPGGSGRRRTAGSAVFGADGRRIAAARATWIAIDPVAFA